jgi:hypothetical protein
LAALGAFCGFGGVFCAAGMMANNIRVSPG